MNINRSRTLVGVFILFGASCTSPRVVQPPKHPEPFVPVVKSSVTVIATGDIMMHNAVKKSAESAGYDKLFEDVGWELAAADIAFANLETPVAPRADKGTRPFVFNAPPILLKELKQTGVDLVSFANNHVYDQGRDGFEETLHQLDSAGIAYVGAGMNQNQAQTPVIFRVNGIRIAFLGFTDVFNDNLNVDDSSAAFAVPLVTEAAIQEIHHARTVADFVVVSIHWGNEYQDAPEPRHQKIARQLMDEGADVILGHHPHVLQPIEVYRAKDGRNCFVVFSLGNAISNQSRFYSAGITPDGVGDTRDGVLLSFGVQRKDYGIVGTRVELADVHYSPIWTENDAARIRMSSIDRAREKLKTELTSLKEKKDKKGTLSDEDSKRYVGLSQNLEALSKRRSIILDRLGEDFAVPMTPMKPLPAKPAPERIPTE